VFYGDVCRSEVCEAFNVKAAKSVIITINDVRTVNKAVISLRRQYPDIPIFARAADADHQRRLQNVLNVNAMVPINPEDSALLMLPFGGEVLKMLGTSPEEIEGILATKRKEISQERLSEIDVDKMIQDEETVEEFKEVAEGGGDDDGGNVVEAVVMPPLEVEEDVEVDAEVVAADQ
jgi:voltage-gated potassium channel Kch